MAISTCTNKVGLQGRELSEHGTRAFPVGCYYDNLQQEPTPWHWHDELEAVVVSSGDVCVMVGEDQTTVRAGDGFFINANMLHAVRPAAGGECRLHSLVFHPRLIAGTMESVFWQRYMQPLISNTSLRFCTFTPAGQPEAVSCIESAWHKCAEEPAGYEFEVRSALSRLIHLLYTGMSAGSAASDSSARRYARKSERDEGRIKLMLQYIQTYYTEELTSAQSAAAAQISESECLRCFRSTIGMPPVQYLRQFRIQEGSRMLLSTDKKIAEIATACGFHNISYFTKTFRDLKGCTPGEFRMKHRSLDRSLDHSQDLPPE